MSGEIVECAWVPPAPMTTACARPAIPRRSAHGRPTVVCVQRVLDIDLDFFVVPPLFWPDQRTRADASAHSVWPTSEVRHFLRNKCRIRSKSPGWVTENHGELFPLWRIAIDDGVLRPPFHVTHVDAHADLGLGDNGYWYLMTELLFEPVDRRRHPRTGDGGLNDANHLLYAVANRWIGELVYVFGEGGGSDELTYAMEGFDPKAQRLQLHAMAPAELDKLLHRGTPVVDRVEPAVPYRSTRWEQFEAAAPFDYVCLTRSPPYTPPTADSLFNVIVDEFIDVR